jgi:hypothetical protein
MDHKKLKDSFGALSQTVGLHKSRIIHRYLER